jgi:sulfatase maturation enzyme AslB (radical SAM superfamily)
VFKATLMFTERCNINCSHCCVNDHAYIGKNQDMSMENVYQYIEQLHELSLQENQPFTLSLSGGEVFLRYQDLKKAVTYAKQKGAYRISCMTNGFWGKDDQQAKDWISELTEAGLHSIGFSLDDFHQEFIPIDSVYKAFEICRESGLEIMIKSVITRSTRRLAEILKDLGDLTINMNLIVQEIACIPEGRAIHQISSDDWWYEKGIPNEPCLAGIMLVIFPDGKTFPCCGTGWNQWLLLGNAQDTTLQDLFEKSRNRAICCLLRDKGPKYFVPYFDQIGYPLPKQGYVNYCHLCQTILTHKKVENILPQAINDWREERVKNLFGDYL